MDESRFWAMIEQAWAGAPSRALAERERLVRRAPGAEDDVEVSEQLHEAIDGVVERLAATLDQLPAAELLAFDRLLEEKLYEIDRAEIQEVTDGSDDGFLYCRGFIVAMGRDFYHAVDADPTMAICDAEAGSMCYVSFHLYHEKFGEVPPSGISRESCSNPDGWADES